MVTQIDKVVIASCGTMFLTFCIDVRFNSAWTFYANFLITAGLFAYGILKEDGRSQYLKQSIIFGVVASLTYLPLDWGLARGAQFVLYLRRDFPIIPGAPLSLVLTRIIAIAVVAYLYHRLIAISVPVFTAAGIVGTVVLLGSTILDQLGTVHYLWLWNSTPLGGRYVVDLPRIGSTPVCVPIALLLTFFLCPYYFYKRQHAIVAGIRCGLFMGTLLFCCFVVFLLFYQVVGV